MLNIRYTEGHRILRSLSFLLALITLFGNSLYAICEGCCHGDSILTNSTATAATAGLPGAAGAAGIPGLAGLPGAPGLAGPPGTIGLPSGVLDYAYIYNTSAGTVQAVGPGADISFNIPAAFTLNPIYFAPGSTFEHNGTASILNIHSPGTYFARYIVTVALGAHSAPTNFELFLGAPFSMPVPGSDRSSDIAPGAGQLTIIGESIFVIPEDTLESALITGINLTVRNNGATTNIGVSPPATTAASLFVQKLGN